MSAQRHPVADLLTPEMKERVRAATFTRRNGDGPIRDMSRVPSCCHEHRVDHCGICPLAVALGADHTLTFSEMHRMFGKRAVRAINDFIGLTDKGLIDPADVKVMLGCSDGAQ